jgi:hypothetical protein
MALWHYGTMALQHLDTGYKEIFLNANDLNSSFRGGLAAFQVYK